MNDIGSRRRLRHASSELKAAERELDAHWLPYRETLRRHRAALLIGGGLVSGFALATIQPKRWARLGALLFGGGARLARSPLLPALLGAFWSGSHRSRDNAGVDDAESDGDA